MEKPIAETVIVKRPPDVTKRAQRSVQQLSKGTEPRRALTPLTPVPKPPQQRRRHENDQHHSSDADGGAKPVPQQEAHAEWEGDEEARAVQTHQAEASEA